MTAYILSLWIHLVAATAWIGGMIFFAAVVVPGLRDASLRPAAPAVLRVVGERYGKFGWATLAVLLVTGCTNLWLRGIGWAQLSAPEFWSSGFGRTLFHKLLLVGLALAAAVSHHVLVRTTPGEPTLAPAARVRASWIGRAILAFSLGVLYFAVKLSRGLP